MADLIEREAHLKDVKSDCPESNVCIAETSCIECIIGRQTAFNRWIPCSEKLPENRCGVIFTVDRGHPFVCVGYRINSEREGLKLQRWFDKLSGLNFSDYDVKAWMPMPDAYEPPEKE